MVYSKLYALGRYYNRVTLEIVQQLYINIYRINMYPNISCKMSIFSLVIISYSSSGVTYEHCVGLMSAGRTWEQSEEVSVWDAEYKDIYITLHKSIKTALSQTGNFTTSQFYKRYNDEWLHNCLNYCITNPKILAFIVKRFDNNICNVTKWIKHTHPIRGKLTIHRLDYRRFLPLGIQQSWVSTEMFNWTSNTNKNNFIFHPIQNKITLAEYYCSIVTIFITIKLKALNMVHWHFGSSHDFNTDLKQFYHVS